MNYDEIIKKLGDDAQRVLKNMEYTIINGNPWHLTINDTDLIPLTVVVNNTARFNLLTNNLAINYEITHDDENLTRYVEEQEIYFNTERTALVYNSSDIESVRLEAFGV